MYPRKIKAEIIGEIKSELDLLMDRVMSKLEKITEEDYANLTEYVNRMTAAKMLDISLPTLTKITNEGKIKQYFISNKCYYKRQELLDLIITDFRSKSDVITNNIKNTATNALVGWTLFDSDKPKTYPPKYGKYLICKKDGKIHWEVWNNTGWAYNHDEIRFWAVIVPPSDLS